MFTYGTSLLIPTCANAMSQRQYFRFAFVMESLDHLLKECELFTVICALASYLVRGWQYSVVVWLELMKPRGVDRKKLIVWVEIDRCMADAVSAVTGARLGKRTLKYVDYGKVAATFLNTASKKALRIVALESSRWLADQDIQRFETSGAPV